MKIPIQLALGHYSLSSGKGTIPMLAELPGPRLGPVNWVLWLWLAMQIAGIAQLGGIAHGVGQAMALSVPLSGDYKQLQERQLAWNVQAAERGRGAMTEPFPEAATADDVIWSGVFVVLTIGLLISGRYLIVEVGATTLVIAFTLTTLFCVAALQLQPSWALSGSDLAQGLSFRLPPIPGGVSTALATLGIIGIGATELVGWVYWLRERGYSKFTGPRSDSQEWADRAKGWMRVMRWDAVCSAVIYTFATVAFFVLGATVLHRQGLDPAGSQMIQTLSEMYVPIFGSWTQGFFLIGAFAVLYSTLFVASATHARVCADALHVFGFNVQTEAAKQAWTTRFIVILPLIAFVFLLFFRQPVRLILISGVSQAAMLPVLGWAALYFRFRSVDKRIGHGRLWDILLVIAFIAVSLTGSWMVLHLIGSPL